MMRKWKDGRGETLIEVLAAILIGALSVTLLFGAIMASTTMDRQAQDMDKNYYEVLSKAERQGSGDELFTPETMPGTPPVVTVKDADGGAEVKIEKVTFYGGEGAISYVLNPPSEGGGT